MNEKDLKSGQPVTRQIESETKAGEGVNSVRVVMTTETTDRQGDVVVSKGIDTAEYMKNPVVLWGHNMRGLPIGRVKAIDAQEGRLEADVEFADTDFAKQVKSLYESGFLKGWSIGFAPKKWEKITDEDGRMTGFKIMESELLELSAVTVPANQEALSKGLAAVQTIMDGLEKLAEKAMTPDANPGEVDTDGVGEPAQTEEKDMSQEQQKPEATPAIDPKAVEAKAVEMERARVKAIREICGEDYAEIGTKAIDEGTSVDAVKDEVLKAVRESRPQAPAAIVRDPVGGEVKAKAIEAAACMAGGVAAETLVKEYGEKVVEEAGKMKAFDLGVMISETAKLAGYEGETRTKTHAPEMLRHIFSPMQKGFSTLSLPGIFSNVANKVGLAAFNAVESGWRSIAKTRNVTDFKTVTSYRLTGDNRMTRIAPDGEIPHGGFGEESFTNKAETYGRMLSITRQDIINDDLDALTAAPQMLFRGAALELNRIFWSIFMDNGTFFTGARGNFADGTATALSVDSLTAAETLFLNQTDADGYPLGVEPAILVVPNALQVHANHLMASTFLNETTTADTPAPGSNPHAGKYQVVRSSYLSNANISGNSAVKWYLLANPMDMAVIEAAFLNGQQTPTIEQAEANFNTLGIQMRGYFDFGVALQDYRGGVAMKGEA